MTVKVRDNGKGVTEGIAELRSGTSGVGIRGMSERAKELGGELQVTNAHPGTIVEVTIPVSVSISSAVPRPEEELTALGTSSDPVVEQAKVGECCLASNRRLCVLQ